MLSDHARPKTAHEYARQAVRRLILGGQLTGGTRLLQTELARRLQVSTTPVREALRDLAAEGLVFFDPHRGAIVRSLDLDEVREIYELRMLLEPVMVRRVIDQLSDEALGRAQDLQDRMDTETDAMAWIELNREFHAVFYEPGQDSRLARIIASLQDSAAAYVGLSLKAEPARMAGANDDHHHLLAAYRGRETETVVQATIDHLQGTLTTIEEADF